MRSRARWYEYGERNSRYFNNLEKRNQKKKHITSLVNNDGDKITNPKDILETFSSRTRGASRLPTFRHTIRYCY